MYVHVKNVDGRKQPAKGQLPSCAIRSRPGARIRHATAMSFRLPLTSIASNFGSTDHRRSASGEIVATRANAKLVLRGEVQCSFEPVRP